MRTLYRHTPKETVRSLPRYLWEGQMVVVDSEPEARRAVAVLHHASLVGFDTETRPSFRPGGMNRVALLQVATNISSDDTCFLFRLCHIGIPPCLKEFFEDSSISKVGLSLTDDLRQLHREADFEPRGFIEIQSMAKEIGVEDMSLQKLYANFRGLRLSKRLRLSNWEADRLSEPQKAYAATDAAVCLHLYADMLALQRSKDFVLTEPTNNEDHTAEAR